MVDEMEVRKSGGWDNWDILGQLGHKLGKKIVPPLNRQARVT